MAKHQQTTTSAVINSAAIIGGSTPVVVEGPKYDKEATIAAAQALAQADVTFSGAIKAVCTSVAAILGTNPSYDLWNAVAAHFQASYVAIRSCKPETAQKRWFAVAAGMEAEFALEKPSKPTVAAAVKAEQRKGAAAEADALIKAAGATTPAAVLALSQAGVKGPVIAALAKVAGSMAADAGKAATEAAREAAKAMREEIRKSLNDLTNAQLEQVRALVQSFKPAAPVAPAAVLTDAGAAAHLGDLVSTD